MHGLFILNKISLNIYMYIGNMHIYTIKSEIIRRLLVSFISYFNNNLLKIDTHSKT